MENVIIKFKNAVVILPKRLINDLKQDSNIETGGIIYGYKLLNREEYVIKGITFQQSDDIGTYCTFKRRDKMHFKILKELWTNDNSLMYLGDWHYHPSDKIKVSSVDLDTFSRVCKKSETDSKYMFYIIVSRREIELFVYTKSSAKIIISKNMLIDEKYF